MLVIAVLAGVVIAALVRMLLLMVGPTPHRVGLADPGHTFDQARVGDCLTWPPDSPDHVSIVGCTDPHRFEVAGAIGAIDAAHGTPIARTSHDQCRATVEDYLGSHYDPNGRFSVGVLSGPPAPRRVLCGLQLPGPDYAQLDFTGRVAELDQSKVWPTGTCLGIAEGSHQSTGIPVDCSQPHAMEVTGTVDLADKFSDAPPPDAQQGPLISDACTKITDAYLAPINLPTTTLTLTASTIPAQSWAAGSRKEACTIGAPRDKGSWATLAGSAKGTMSINGQSPPPRSAAAASPSATSAPSLTSSHTATQILPPAPHLSPGPSGATPPDPNAPPDAGSPDNPPSGPAPGPPTDSEPPAAPAP